jgi:Mor family transcriptional regulator
MSKAETKERMRVFVPSCVALAKTRLIASLGLTEAQAEDLAGDLIHDICVEHSGRYMYVPSDYEYTLSKRDHEIYNAYNSRNMVQICEKYGITHGRVYQIIKIVHAQELAKRQPTLPGL